MQIQVYGVKIKSYKQVETTTIEGVSLQKFFDGLSAGAFQLGFLQNLK
jgi:hypothetical protein